MSVTKGFFPRQKTLDKLRMLLDKVIYPPPSPVNPCEIRYLQAPR